MKSPTRLRTPSEISYETTDGYNSSTYITDEISNIDVLGLMSTGPVRDDIMYWLTPRLT